MTAENFVRWIEGYYGEYRPVVKQEVTGWLDEYRDDVLDEIYERLKETYTNVYKNPPDIAQLAKCLPTKPDLWPWQSAPSLKKIGGGDQKRLTGKGYEKASGLIGKVTPDLGGNSD